MELTGQQYLYLWLSVIVGSVVAWGMAFLCMRSKPEVIGAIFTEGGYGLRILTVFFILIAGTMLAMGGKLSSEIAVILAGIAGYVLGGIQKPLKFRYQYRFAGADVKGSASKLSLFFHSQNIRINYIFHINHIPRLFSIS